MLTVVLITLLGTGIGYVLRRHSRWLQYVDRTILLTIFVMLFVLGWSVGGNDDLVRHLPSCGGQAALIAVAAMVGSACLAGVVHHFFFSGEGGDGADE